MESNPTLRLKLQQITNENPDDWSTLARLPARIIELAGKHQVDIALRPYPSGTDDRNVNCHAYTFRFHLRTDYDGLKCEPDGSFVWDLIDRGVLQEVSPADHDFVVYFDAKSVKHSGTLDAGHVCSKWGGGSTWNHALYDVPSCYGSEVRYYKRVAADLLFQEFRTWAARNHA